MITSQGKSLVFCLAAFTAAFLQPTTAAASVTVHDWGSTSYDSSTSLEWLDLSFTAGKSYQEIASGWGGFTTTGGYRFATRDEIITLFTHAGGVSIGTPEGAGIPENLAAAQHLLNLLGSTGSLPGGSWMAYDPATEPSVLPTHSAVAVLGVDQMSRGYMLVPGLFPTLSYASPEIASALVRVVPEPSSAALLLSGMGCLSWIRRRRRHGA